VSVYRSGAHLLLHSFPTRRSSDLGIWATFFYINILDDIYDSIDDGLDNSKILIIQKAAEDSTIMNRTNFMESNYAIHEITAAQRSEEHTSELQSRENLVCRLLLEK